MICDSPQVCLLSIDVKGVMQVFSPFLQERLGGAIGGWSHHRKGQSDDSNNGAIRNPRRQLQY